MTETIPAFIAIDWGSTNRRAYLVDQAGMVLRAEREGKGLLSVPDDGFAAEVAAIRSRLGDLPVVLAGMVGSARGWANVPYVRTPAGIDDLAAHLYWVEAGRTAIVPGLADPAGDVMRGEEVQFLGAVAAGLAPPDGLLCQPGTHCKWARMADGKIASFSTAMTGELFGLLRDHSLLADFLSGDVHDGEAFRAGAAAGLHGSLSTLLFRIRAAALLGSRSVEDSAAYASGVLIGHDVGGAQLEPGANVQVIADAHLGTLYAAALAIAGANTTRLDSHDAFVAGIHRIWKASAA